LPASSKATAVDSGYTDAVDSPTLALLARSALVSASMGGRVAGVRCSISVEPVEAAQDDTFAQRPRTDPHARYGQEAHRRGSHDRTRRNLMRTVR
jgi:hypothetical protein